MIALYCLCSTSVFMIHKSILSFLAQNRYNAEWNVFNFLKSLNICHHTPDTILLNCYLHIYPKYKLELVLKHWVGLFYRFDPKCGVDYTAVGPDLKPTEEPVVDLCSYHGLRETPLPSPPNICQNRGEKDVWWHHLAFLISSAMCCLMPALVASNPLPDADFIGNQA